MARNRSSTKIAFVHCSATRAKQDIGAKTIHEWHLKRGIYSERGLTGYHFIIRRSGLIELGRDLPAIGAHALGFNAQSVGVCLIGGARSCKEGEVSPDDSGLMPEDNFYLKQYDALETTARFLLSIYPDIVFAPHNLVASKACPSFDLWAWQRARFGRDDELRAKKVIAEIRGD